MRSSRRGGTSHLHAHNNVGEGIGRMLVRQTAGGLYEHFFERVSKKAADGEVRPPVLEDHPDLRSTGARGRARHPDTSAPRRV